MNFGLTQEEYDFIADRVVKPVEVRGGKVFCYGSRARGDYQRYSDLDLMIEAEADLSSLVGELQEGRTQSAAADAAERLASSHMSYTNFPSSLRTALPAFVELIRQYLHCRIEWTA